MAESFGEKTEAPTPKRKRKAVEDGQLLKSRDFGTALIVLTGCAWMALLGPSLIAACKDVMTASFSFGRGDIDDFQPWRAFASAGWKLAPSLAILFAFAFHVRFALGAFHARKPPATALAAIAILIGVSGFVGAMLVLMGIVRIG